MSIDMAARGGQVAEGNLGQTVVHSIWRRFGHPWAWAAVGVILLMMAVARIHFLKVPLERDEGEYAYAGQLILQGCAPYDRVYNMKMPGIYAAYAGIMALCGQSCTGIHLGLLIVNGVTIILVFLLGRRLAGPSAGVFAAAAFAVMSLAQSVLGPFAHAEHFVLPFALAGILLLLRATDRNSTAALLTGAVLLGIGFLMKQHGAGFILLAGFYLLCREVRRQPLRLKSLLLKGGVFTAGILLPFGVTCLLLLHAGVFKRFWFWTVVYAREYVSLVPLRAGVLLLESEIPGIVLSAAAIWVLAGVGLLALFISRRLREHSLFLLGFLICSFLCTCPGFYFRNHYFLLLLPAIALLSGVGLAGIQQVLAGSKLRAVTIAVPVVVGVGVLSAAMFQQKDFLSLTDVNVVSRVTYDDNPFPESLKIAEYIKAHTSSSDTVAILGSEPQILFYANRRSATGYIYAYPLMEPHPYALEMQKDMIQQIETAKPKFLVFVDVSMSWLAAPNSNTYILKWFQTYQDKYYKMVGAIDIVPASQTIYRWDEKGFEHNPCCESWIAVLERKDAI
jgi:hypothetical protein